MCDVNNRQTVFLRSILEWMNTMRTFDSHVRNDGWTVTSHARQYVAFNKYKCNNKVVYAVHIKNHCLCLQLTVSVKNPTVKDFRTTAERKGEVFHHFNGRRDCGVERTISVDGDRDAVMVQVFGELDKLYVEYNAVVDVGCMSRTKGTCKKAVCVVEALPVQKLNSRYSLSWTGWKKFYDEWDAFVKTWFESGAKPHDNLTRILEGIGAFMRQDPNTRLDRMELPEPYYGSGENAKCAVVNLNPGTSNAIDIVKVFGKGGFLIQSFEQNCSKKYSLFAGKWSPLRESYCNGIQTKDVPGHVWWYNNNRKKFFERFFGVKNLAEVFSLEACPYHSKRWSGGLDAMEKHVIDKVVTPAAVIAEQNNNCAVFVGSAFNPLIAKIEGVEPIGRWRGTRVYSLYKLTLPIDGLNNRKPIFLLVVNGTQGMFLPRSIKSNIEIESIIHEIVNESFCYFE